MTEAAVNDPLRPRLTVAAAVKVVVEDERMREFADRVALELFRRMDDDVIWALPEPFRTAFAVKVLTGVDLTVASAVNDPVLVDRTTESAVSDPA